MRTKSKAEIEKLFYRDNSKNDPSKQSVPTLKHQHQKPSLEYTEVESEEERVFNIMEHRKSDSDAHHDITDNDTPTKWNHPHNESQKSEDWKQRKPSIVDQDKRIKDLEKALKDEMFFKDELMNENIALRAYLESKQVQSSQKEGNYVKIGSEIKTRKDDSTPKKQKSSAAYELEYSLKMRIAELEDQVRELREINEEAQANLEMAVGGIQQAREIEIKSTALEAENKKLKLEMNQLENSVRLMMVKEVESIKAAYEEKLADFEKQSKSSHTLNEDEFFRAQQLLEENESLKYQLKEARDKEERSKSLKDISNQTNKILSIDKIITSLNETISTLGGSSNDMKMIPFTASDTILWMEVNSLLSTTASLSKIASTRIATLTSTVERLEKEKVHGEEERIELAKEIKYIEEQMEKGVSFQSREEHPDFKQAKLGAVSSNSNMQQDEIIKYLEKKLGIETKEKGVYREVFERVKGWLLRPEIVNMLTKYIQTSLDLVNVVSSIIEIKHEIGDSEQLGTIQASSLTGRLNENIKKEASLQETKLQLEERIETYFNGLRDQQAELETKRRQMSKLVDLETRRSRYDSQDIKEPEAREVAGHSIPVKTSNSAYQSRPMSASSSFKDQSSQAQAPANLLNNVHLAEHQAGGYSSGTSQYSQSARGMLSPKPVRDALAAGSTSQSTASPSKSTIGKRGVSWLRQAHRWAQQQLQHA